jgi:hypothetical protein
MKVKCEESDVLKSASLPFQLSSSLLKIRKSPHQHKCLTFTCQCSTSLAPELQ